MNGAILIAEDHEVARKSIQQFLQQHDYRVEEAVDGEAAIEAINNSNFDLVITDLKMPEASGLDVLKRVREVSPSTFVIVTTAFGTVESAIEALRYGAQDYVIKPIIFDDLLSKVRHLMEYKRLAWELQILRRQLSSLSPALSDLVGRSQAMQNIIGLIHKVADSDSRFWSRVKAAAAKKSWPERFTPKAREKTSSSCQSIAAPSRILFSKASFSAMSEGRLPGQSIPTKDCSNGLAAGRFSSMRLPICRPHCSLSYCGPSKPRKFCRWVRRNRRESM